MDSAYLDRSQIFRINGDDVGAVKQLEVGLRQPDLNPYAKQQLQAQLNGILTQIKATNRFGLTSDNNSQDNAKKFQLFQLEF